MLVLLGFGCKSPSTEPGPDTDSDTDVPGVCGDGVLEPGEPCEPGLDPYYDCTADCESTCGDGVATSDESCFRLPPPLTDSELVRSRGGDLDSDGYFDLVTATADALGRRLGDGTGTFGPEEPLDYTDPCGEASDAHKPLGVMDLDGDGRDDLIASHYAGGFEYHVEILWGRTDGAFVGLCIQNLLAVRPSDPNGDGLIDLVGLGSPGLEVAVLRQTGPRAFSGAGTEMYSATVPVFHDFVPGGAPEIVFDDAAGVNRAAAIEGATVTQLVPGGALVAVADLDADGCPDPIVRFDGSNQWLPCAAPLADARTLPSGIERVAGTGDVDGDGDDDLLAADGGLWINDGAGNFARIEVPGATGTPPPNPIFLGDVDGNGALDVLHLAGPDSQIVLFDP